MQYRGQKQIQSSMEKEIQLGGHMYHPIVYNDLPIVW